MKQGNKGANLCAWQSRCVCVCVCVCGREGCVCVYDEEGACHPMGNKRDISPAKGVKQETTSHCYFIVWQILQVLATRVAPLSVVRLVACNSTSSKCFPAYHPY